VLIRMLQVGQQRVRPLVDDNGDLGAGPGGPAEEVGVPVERGADAVVGEAVGVGGSIAGCEGLADGEGVRLAAAVAVGCTVSAGAASGRLRAPVIPGMEGRPGGVAV